VRFKREEFVSGRAFRRAIASLKRMRLQAPQPGLEKATQPNPYLLHQVKRLLSWHEELVPIVREIRVVFHHDVDLLPVPLGNRGLRIQLNREVRALA